MFELARVGGWSGLATAGQLLQQRVGAVLPLADGLVDCGAVFAEDELPTGLEYAVYLGEGGRIVGT